MGATRSAADLTTPNSNGGAFFWKDVDSDALHFSVRDEATIPNGASVLVKDHITANAWHYAAFYADSLTGGFSVFFSDAITTLFDSPISVNSSTLDPTKFYASELGFGTSLPTPGSDFMELDIDMVYFSRRRA